MSDEIGSVSESALETEIDELDFVVTEEHLENARRLDQLLGQFLPYSRSFLKKLYDDGRISLSPQSPFQGKLDFKKLPPVGTIINIDVPPAIPLEAEAENIPLDILFEDEHLLFINKAAGMVVHPAPGHYTGTLVNAVLFHCPDLKGIGGVKRPGIVHRLDKGTSGVMVVAKSAEAHEKLVEIFAKHTLERFYTALTLRKEITVQGTITTTIGRSPNNRQKMATNIKDGKVATTHYRVLKQNSEFNLLELKLETGRTHQIRVHLSSILQTPVLMDPLYGHPPDHIRKLSTENRELLKNYLHPLLHAKSLAFKHPITGEQMFFETPPPSPFKEVLENSF